MRGGLLKGYRFKNVNGSCLINASLNSILNSYELITKLYEATPITLSLTNTFSDILKKVRSDEKEDLYMAFRHLLSAFIHDFIRNSKYTDKDKLLFSVIEMPNLNIAISNGKFKEFDDKYTLFNHSAETRADDSFVSLISPYSTHLVDMPFNKYDGIIKIIKGYLTHYKDIFILLTDRYHHFDNVSILKAEDIKCLRAIFKAAFTATNEYVCTDMIMYKGNEKEYPEYTHVVYYNILDSTLLDDYNNRENILISDYIPTVDCKSFSDYTINNGKLDIYIPTVLHFQKIPNTPSKLGLISRIDSYASHKIERINFAKEVAKSQDAEWCKLKTEDYIKYLNTLC